MKLYWRRWRRRSLRSLLLMPRGGSTTAATRSRFSIYECRCKVKPNGGVGVRGAIGNLAVCERLSFRLAWLIISAQLRLSASSTFHSLPPSGPEVASHLSVIIRLPQHIVSSVASTLERLREVGSHHYYYPADSMHVTVGSASRFISD